MSKTNMDKNVVNEEEEDKVCEEEDVTDDSLNSIDSLKDVKTVLSIDIGTKNFGYCIIQYYSSNLSNPSSHFKYSFNTIEIGTNIQSRYTILKKFLKKVTDTYELSYIFIEKQVRQNTVAMCVMYMLYSMCCEYVPKECIKLFVPLQKFKVFSLPFSCKNKKHKKLSVMYAENFLWNTNEKAYEKLQGFKKKDDVCDALNQCICSMYLNGMLELDKKDIKSMYMSRMGIEVCRPVPE